jgi:short-subunit dehydrogenase
VSSIHDLFGLAGKTAVVTTASYGLAIAFAEALGMQDVNLVPATRRQTQCVLSQIDWHLGKGSV